MADPRLARPLWRGRTNVDALTIAALEYAEKIAGKRFVVTQGSYQSSVAASAGTHDRGGAVDLRWSTVGNSGVLALRKAGFAAWHRTPAQGGWVDHVHAVLVGHPDLAPSAARQVTAYRNGRNGLANNGPDDGPRLNPIPVFTWQEKDWLDMATESEVRKIVREELLAVLNAAGVVPVPTTEAATVRKAYPKGSSIAYALHRIWITQKADYNAQLADNAKDADPK